MKADALAIFSLAITIIIITVITKRKENLNRSDITLPLIWLILGIGGITALLNSPLSIRIFYELKYIMKSGLIEPIDTIRGWGELVIWWARLALVLQLTSYSLAIVGLASWQWFQKIRASKV